MAIPSASAGATTPTVGEVWGTAPQHWEAAGGCAEGRRMWDVGSGQRGRGWMGALVG